jgi:hypothetical protein
VIGFVPKARTAPNHRAAHGGGLISAVLIRGNAPFLRALHVDAYQCLIQEATSRKSDTRLSHCNQWLNFSEMGKPRTNFINHEKREIMVRLGGNAPRIGTFVGYPINEN